MIISKNRGAKIIAVKISVGLKKLLLASNLGLNANHPLAGWNILTILYHDGTRGGEPITLNFLLQRYNLEYLDTDHSESPISDSVLKKILVTLSEQAQLIEVLPRKMELIMFSILMSIGLRAVELNILI